MDDWPWLLAASALPVGAALGFVLQRGAFCPARAVAGAVLARDAELVRAYVLALLVATVGLHALIAAGAVEVPVRPLRWVAHPLGGALFGVGMMLSGGCAGGAWCRAGEGALGAWVVLLGFAIGATTAGVGTLSPLRVALQRPVIAAGDAGGLTLSGVLEVSPWAVIAPLAAVAGAWLWRGRSRAGPGRWPWPVTGVLLGALVAAAWWTSGLADRPTGITFAPATGHLLTYPMVGYPGRATWPMLMALAVPLGSFAAARWRGEFRWSFPPGWSLVKGFTGGLLMGAAALLAEGCAINQALTTAATLAVGGLVSTAATVAGAWAALRILDRRTA